jgi:hypothetical protein
MRNPQLTARTRNGYYGVPDSSPSFQELDSLLSRAVINPLAYHSLAVQARAKISHSQPRTARITMQLDTGGLQWQLPGGGEHRCEITVVAAGFSSTGRVVAHTLKELEVVVDDRKYLQLTKKGMVMNLVVELPPTVVRMRVVARDSTNGNIGTADLTPEGAQFH